MSPGKVGGSMISWSLVVVRINVNSDTWGRGSGIVVVAVAVAVGAVEKPLVESWLEEAWMSDFFLRSSLSVMAIAPLGRAPGL